MIPSELHGRTSAQVPALGQVGLQELARPERGRYHRHGHVSSGREGTVRVLEKSKMDSGWAEGTGPVPRNVGYDRRPAGWMDTRRLIYDHQLVFLGPRAHWRVEFDEVDVEVPGGSFIIIPPGLWHRRRSLVDHPSLRGWVHFDWETPAQPWPVRSRGILYSREEFQPECVRHSPARVPDGILTGAITNFDRFFKRHERLNAMFNEGTDRDRLLCRGVLLEHLLDLLAPPHASGPPTPGDPATGIRQALAELASLPFQRAPSIRATLEARGLSYDHQARIFRDAYGLTPIQYVNSLRVERARFMLRDTDLQVNQVALALGFADVPYFNRMFSKYTGCSPTEYRAQQTGC
jgi:AraC-like DNA-binding protein